MAKSLSNIIRAGSPSTPLPVSFGGTGLTLPGASGNVLTSNGTNWVSGAAPVSVSTGDIVFSTDSSTHASPTYLPCTGQQYSSSTYSALSTKLQFSDFVSSEGSLSGLSTIYNILHNGSIYIIVANDVYTSPDGITWTKRLFTGGQNYAPMDGATNSGSTIVLPGDAYCWTSVDSGVTWATYKITNITSPNNTGKIAYGNSKFVIVNSSSIAVYSSDGITWTDCTSPPPSANYIKYINSTFVVTNGGANIWYSTDGITWSFTTYTGAQFQDISYGNGNWVAVGSSGKIYSGTSLSSLTVRSSGTSYSFIRVEYGSTAGKWVAVGYQGLICYSSDSTTWTVVSGISTSLYFYTLATDGTTYIAGTASGCTYKSSNGTSWTLVKDSRITPSSYMNTLKYINSKFTVVNSYGCFSTSSDGTTWTINGNTGYYGITLSENRKFINTGSLVVIPAANGVVTTSDNITFTPRTFASNTPVALKYNGTDKFVALFNSQFTSPAQQAYYSSDGITWTASSSTFGSTFVDDQLAYGNGIWVLGTSSTYIYTSTDGVTWTQRIVGQSNVYSVSFWKGYFILGCSNYNYYSSDGINWYQNGSDYVSNSNFVLNDNYYYYKFGLRRLSDPKAGSYQSVTGLGTISSVKEIQAAYGNGIYVIGIIPGYQSANLIKLAYSTDGLNFYSCILPTTYTSGSDPKINHVCFVNNTFFAFQADGIHYTSSDGILWTTFKCPYQYMGRLSYFNNKYVLYGNNSLSTLSTTTFRTPIIQSPVSAYIKS